MLDNEAPNELKAAIYDHGFKVELTPPGIHRRTIAECGIQIFKGHLIAVLSGMADDCPILELNQL